MAFTKITTADRIGKGNVGQPDTPGLTTAEMQELMDSLPNLAIDKFNNHIDELGLETAASNIGASLPDGILANKNIQSILNTLAYQLGLVENVSHSHSNKETLDEVTEEFKTEVDALLIMLTGINSIAASISSGSTNAELPTAKSVVDYLQTEILSNVVTSFNNRVGAVFPHSGDYAASDITYRDSTVEAKLDDIHDMTGATASFAGSHGLVPKPGIGEQNKILYGSGLWGDPPINYLSGLEDVSITALQNNQSLVYNTALGKWINKLIKEIISITKTGTSGLVDTYTITYIDGSTSTFTVTNGKSAYQSAVDGGYTGTEAQFNEELAGLDDLVDDAESAAAMAQTYATNAEGFSDTAAQSASDASNSADLAAEYARIAQPDFIIENNRLYLKDNNIDDFVVANNRLYVKLAS